MKKYFIAAFLLCTFLGLGQVKSDYQIGILADFSTEDTQGLFTQLINEIEAVVGEDTQLSFPESARLSNNFDESLARQQYQSLVQSDVDMILAFGIINNKVIVNEQQFPKPVILFGAVNKDLIDANLDRQTSGVENFTSIIQSQSIMEDLRKFQEIASFKNLGIAVEQPIIDVLPYRELLDGYFSDKETTYTLIPFQTVSDITGRLDDVDALYLSGGFFLNESDIKLLAKACIEAKLPSFSANGVAHVRNGLLATYQTDESIPRIFRRIALTVEAHISGTPLSGLNVYLNTEPRLTINYNTADYIGVPLRYSLIGETDFVGEFRNVLSEKSYSLLDVINDALENNLTLNSEEKEVELSLLDVRSAKSNYLPSVTAAANGTYTDPDSAEISNGLNPEFQTAGNITLSQTLFSEAANANISIQKKLQKAQSEDYRAEQLNTIFDAANVYFNALILKANAQIQIRNLDLTKRNLQIAEQNYKAGEAGKTDKLRFQSQMAQNMQTMIEALNGLEQGLIGLKQVMNIPLDTEIDVNDVSLDDSIFSRYNYDQFIDLLDDPSLREPFIEFLISEAKTNAPELKSLQYNLEAVERNIRLSGSGRFLPSVALQGQYNRIFSRSGAGSTAPLGTSFLNDNYNIGLSLSIPLVNQNQNNINNEIARVQKDQLDINKENIELSISANVRNGVLNLVNEVSNIELSKVSEDTAKQSLELTQTSYLNGAVNIIQLIDAQNNYLNAQLARTNAIYNYLIQSLQLERFIGSYFLLNTEDQNNAFLQRFLEFNSNRN